MSLPHRWVYLIYLRVKFWNVYLLTTVWSSQGDRVLKSTYIVLPQGWPGLTVCHFSNVEPTCVADATWMTWRTWSLSSWSACCMWPLHRLCPPPSCTSASSPSPGSSTQWPTSCRCRNRHVGSASSSASSPPCPWPTPPCRLLALLCRPCCWQCKSLCACCWCWLFLCTSLSLTCGKFRTPYLGKAQQLQEHRYPFLPVHAVFLVVQTMVWLPALSIFNVQSCWYMWLPFFG